MNAQNKVAFTQEIKDYVEYLVLAKNHEPKVVMAAVEHMFPNNQNSPLELYALVSTIKENQKKGA